MASDQYVRFQRHSFWNENEVPAEEDQEFKSLMCRDFQKELEADQRFRPKDEHCGIWHSPPNKACHASFGDQGTTASVSCCGDLLQLSQYLGIGRSGVFSLDHLGAEDPYWISDRASQLHKLSKDIDAESFRSGLLLSKSFRPNQALEVKWVNWRWPRYEYRTPGTNVQVSIQWVVHDGIVSQQILLNNLGDTPADFSYSLKRNVLIRDLDHLVGSYKFNEADDDESYKSMSGPNGYSHICVHMLEENGSGSRGRVPPATTIENGDDAVVGGIATTFQGDKAPESEPYAVASVATLFFDGGAVKMRNDISDEHTLEVRKSVEIVVAYKLVALPTTEVHWRNFLVTADEADVSKFLCKETEGFWGSGTDVPLCSLGLSMVDHNDATLETTTGRRSEGSRGSDDLDQLRQAVPKDMAVSGDMGVEGSTALHEAGGDAGTPVNNQTSETKLAPGPEKISFPSGTPKNSSPKGHLEYLAWRHLEHILSDCAIPLLVPHLYKQDECHHRVDTIPVALTCGDMSGHRISTSASFFAFQFLIEVARRLRVLDRETPYISKLRQRVEGVCRGHIRWLEGLAHKMLMKFGSFATSFWVTGKTMDTTSYRYRRQRMVAITDTPFQILKIVDCIQCYSNKGNEDMLRQLLGEVQAPWLQELHKIIQGKKFAWPRSKDAGVDKFRLDDHFWVWKALKSLEDLGVCSNQQPREPVALDTTPGFDVREFAKVAKRLQSGNVQREILQRFTTENDVTRKRMLAVTRSARETRFLFHARDTALFYGSDCDFFMPGSDFHELWENSIEAQIYHDENRETDWENAIRYALGIMAGTRDHCLNQQQSATNLVKECVEVLIRSGGHNGFFAGQLDRATKEPILFLDDKDVEFYHHADFEINYILLTHAKRIESIYQESTISPRPSQKQPLSTSSGKPKPQEVHIDESLRRFTSELAGFLAEVTAQPKRQKMVKDSGDQESDLFSKVPQITQRLDGGRTSAMKKTMPFNTLIDTSSITISASLEDEWLYNYPDFLSTEQIGLLDRIHNILKSDHPSRDSSDGFIAQILKEYRATDKGFLFLEDAYSLLTGIFVADTPKQKHLEQVEKRRFMRNPFMPLMFEPTLNLLGAARTAEKAKKRFIWLPEANVHTVLVCWMASTETEKSALSLFFDRHAKYQKYSWDDTTMVLNIWQTELHLSFYVLADIAGYSHVGLPPEIKDHFPGNSEKGIWRASIGFRFDGDFFDRYWTCHFIELNPRRTQSRFDWWGQAPMEFLNRHTDKEWRQRKVLELQLLDRILVYILHDSKEILGQALEQILQLVEEDLTSTLSTLQKWSTREKDRGKEQPRWTRNDERKYRGAINKLQASNDRHVRDLEIRRDDIRKFKEALTMRRDKLRQDLEFRGNENIRYFTYVTVIFLPLSFAASFYSMSGAPDQSLTISLVEFSAAAFAITVFLLYNAKPILSAAELISSPVSALITAPKERFVSAVTAFAILLKKSLRKRTVAAMKRSLLVEEHRKEKHHTSEDNERSTIDSKDQESQNHSAGSIASFWIAYIFLELPARRVLRAVLALRKGKLSIKATVNVVLGVIFMPVYGTSWLLNFLVVNILDLARYLIRLVPDLKSLRRRFRSTAKSKHDDSEDEKEFLRQLRNMTVPPQSFRPLKSG
ncbi:hypothetical protein VPNG_02145 [Cytospora leucostoma]|uniref:Uncharacterized protein n=1 Tax=Cytospora leucostoma TaxID=1230097 RepID=A0A423XGZ9_9PEZI|nr:hypothetical protein VPNG_02145 [Cytospora leucostoma]